MKSGIELIAEERQEQIEKHGRTIESDVKLNSEHQLIHAIMMLASNIGFTKAGMTMPSEAFNDLIPEGWSVHLCLKMMDKDVIGQLKVLGAFAAAEIDRLQYNKEK